MVSYRAYSTLLLVMVATPLSYSLAPPALDLQSNVSGGSTAHSSLKVLQKRNTPLVALSHRMGRALNNGNMPVMNTLHAQSQAIRPPPLAHNHNSNHASPALTQLTHPAMDSPINAHTMRAQAHLRLAHQAHQNGDVEARLHHQSLYHDAMIDHHEHERTYHTALHSPEWHRHTADMNNHEAHYFASSGLHRHMLHVDHANGFGPAPQTTLANVQGAYRAAQSAARESREHRYYAQHPHLYNPNASSSGSSSSGSESE